MCLEGGIFGLVLAYNYYNLMLSFTNKILLTYIMAAGIMTSQTAALSLDNLLA